MVSGREPGGITEMGMDVLDLFHEFVGVVPYDSCSSIQEAKVFWLVDLRVVLPMEFMYMPAEEFQVVPN